LRTWRFFFECLKGIHPETWQAVHDGRIEIDNHAVERALQAVVPGGKNYSFAVSDQGGESAAAIHSLIRTAKRNGIEAGRHRRNVLSGISDHPINGIEELLPWNLAEELRHAAR
jgi:transposase